MSHTWKTYHKAFNFSFSSVSSSTCCSSKFPGTPLSKQSKNEWSCRYSPCHSISGSCKQAHSAGITKSKQYYTRTTTGGSCRVMLWAFISHFTSHDLFNLYPTEIRHRRILLEHFFSTRNPLGLHQIWDKHW